MVMGPVWTVPKARGVKTSKKIRPDSMILLQKDIIIKGKEVGVVAF